MTSLTELKARLDRLRLPSLAGLRHALRRPSRRQTYILAGAAAVLLGVQQLVVAPINAEREDLALQIETDKKRLKDIVSLSGPYLQARERLEGFKASLAKRGPDFSLFALVDSLAARSAVKDRIEVMRPASKSVNREYNEERVEMRLIQVSLDRLTNFLHAVETAPEAVRVRKLTVQTKNPRNVVLDSVDLVVETYVPAPHPAAPARK